MYVVLGLLGLKKKKKNPCVCSPRSPWFEKKKKIIHVYVVLGLLGLKKKKIHIHVLQGEAPETQRFTRPAALCCPPPAVLPSAAPQKRPASAALGAAPSAALGAALGAAPSAALGAAPPSPKRPYVVEEPAADVPGMVRKQAFSSQLSINI